MFQRSNSRSLLVFCKVSGTDMTQDVVVLSCNSEATTNFATHYQCSLVQKLNMTLLILERNLYMHVCMCVCACT